MGSSGSSPKVASTLNGLQKIVATQLQSSLSGSKGLGSPAPKYPGQLTAALDPQYQQVRNLIGTYNPNQFSADQASAVTRGLSGQSAFNLDPSVTQQWFQGAVAAPAYRNFDQYVLPRLNDAFAGNNFFNSGRGRAVGQALGDLQTNTNAQLASVQQQMQVTRATLADSAANRQLQSVGMAQALSEQPLQQAQALGGAIAPFQNYQQQLLNTNYNEWLRRQPFASGQQRTQDALSFVNTPMEALYQQQSGGIGGGGIGALAGVAAGVVGAPFTGGASLALIPALAAAGGAVGGAVSPSGGSGSNIGTSLYMAQALSQQSGANQNSGLFGNAASWYQTNGWQLGGSGANSAASVGSAYDQAYGQGNAGF